MTSPKHPPPANGTSPNSSEGASDGSYVEIERSSLISEINAPFDPQGDAVWELMHRGYENTEAIAIIRERARCRAIVARLFGNDWTGNEALRLIDEG